MPLIERVQAGVLYAIPNGFNVLRFGASCLTRLDDDKIFVAFWRYEDCVCP